ncbi:hypothetical protein BG006_002669 [Podila minutissima]|uniref:Uncharacterized protein n=1 Tax=Podila minutissima TaxID=64525 RepID=A0A9P5S905_9FUNG|nr:hypothetical protein BG006_002669 [Podila minutissima]
MTITITAAALETDDDKESEPLPCPLVTLEPPFARLVRILTNIAPALLLLVCIASEGNFFLHIDAFATRNGVDGVIKTTLANTIRGSIDKSGDQGQD